MTYFTIIYCKPPDFIKASFNSWYKGSLEMTGLSNFNASSREIFPEFNLVIYKNI
jgi:hypothetical protein